MRQVKSDGFMVSGSRGQQRCHQAMVEVRAISTEMRLIEAELGMTPASESRAAVPAIPTFTRLEAMRLERESHQDFRRDPEAIALLADLRARKEQPS